ncbi:MAG: phosphotransacetylase [Bryobacterales bacterium]|nr:phosphotransacetylase [Bryobacterales bacterium]
MALPDTATRFLEGLYERARRQRKRIVFPEGSDPRVRAAAERLAAEQLAHPVLVGPAGAGAPPGVSFADPGDPGLIRKYGALYYERRRTRGLTLTEAQAAAARPLYFASLMVAAGDADVFVGGAANTTAETVRAAIQCVGVKPGARRVSGFFLMAVRNPQFGHNGLMLFADCGVIAEPSAVELADIAITTACTARALLRTEPCVALLSFSTKGSSRHRGVARIVEALRIVRARAPELNVDGELQADAALVPFVGRAKAPGSTVAGRANVLIFPNLDAANIGYKLVERLGDAAAFGPFLQGVAKPMSDLSRGGSVDDISNAAVITSLEG